MRVVVPQAAVHPVTENPVVRTVAVLLGEPPVESVHIAVLLQLGDQVLGKSLLTLGRDRPFRRKIKVDAAAHLRLPLVIVSRLHDLHLLVGERRRKHIQRLRQHRKRIVPERIVGETYHIIIQGSHPRVETFQHLRLAGTLRVDDDLRLRADLPASLHGLTEQIDKTAPVGVRRIAVAAVGFGRTVDVGAPEHSVRNLIARLDEVGSGALRHKTLQTSLSVIVYFSGELRLAQRRPLLRDPLVRRIRPSVAVMEVQKQRETLRLDALAETNDIVKILADLCVGLSVRILLRRIHEKTHALRIPAHGLAAQIAQHIRNLLAVRIQEIDPGILIALQDGNIPAHIHSSLLGRRLRLRLRIRDRRLAAGESHSGHHRGDGDVNYKQPFHLSSAR